MSSAREASISSSVGKKSARGRCLLAAVVVSSCAAGARGAVRQWDADGSGTPGGGAGTWDSTTARWWDGTAYRVWDNGAGDAAVFGGSGGAVSADGVTARATSFTADGYDLAGALTLTSLGTGTGTSAARVVNVTAGSATISAAITSTDTVTKLGSGRLLLSGNNAAWTGGLDVRLGMVEAAASALPSGHISVIGGGPGQTSVLYTSGVLNRAIGSGPGQISFGGGDYYYPPILSGRPEGLTVNFGGQTTPQTYDWDTPGLTGGGNALNLGGTLTLLNPLRLGTTGSGFREVRGSTGGNVVLAGDLSNTGGTWGLLVNGQVTLSGNNTFNGNITFRPYGTLIAGSSTAVPAGAHLVWGESGGTLKLADGVTARLGGVDAPDPGVYTSNLYPAGIDTGNGTLELTGGISYPKWSYSGAAPLTISGNVILPAGEHVFDVSGRYLTLAARFTGPGTIRKTGGREVYFQGTQGAGSTVDYVWEGGDLEVQPGAGAPTAPQVGFLGTGKIDVYGGVLRGAGRLTNTINAHVPLLVSGLQLAGPISLGSSAMSGSNAVVLGPISAPAGTTITLSDYMPRHSGPSFTLAGANTFDNPLLLDGANVVVTHPQALGTGTSSVTLQGNAVLNVDYRTPLSTQRSFVLDGPNPPPSPGTLSGPQITGSGKLDAEVRVRNSAIFWGNVDPKLALTITSVRSDDPAAPPSLQTYWYVTAGHLDVGRVELHGTLALSDQSGPVEAGRVTALVDPGVNSNARFDVRARGLVIDYPADGTASPAADTRAKIVQARNGGAWNGAKGITSSVAAADVLAGRATAVGYAEASTLLGIGAGETRTWLGQTVDATSVLVRCTVAGDATLDGVVNFNDLLALAKSYNTTGPAVGWAQGDYDYNGTVNFNDLLVLAKNYNQAVAAPVALGATAEFNADVAAAFAAAVPEPAAGSLVLAAGAWTGARRRRRV